MSWKIGDSWPSLPKKAYWYIVLVTDANTDKFIEWAKSTDSTQGRDGFIRNLEDNYQKMFHRKLRPNRDERIEQREKSNRKGYDIDRMGLGRMIDSRFDKIYNELYSKIKPKTARGGAKKQKEPLRIFIDILNEQHGNYLERAENYANGKTSWFEKSGSATTDLKRRVDEALDQETKDRIYDALEDNHNIYPKLSKIFPYGKIERKNYKVVENFGPKKAAEYFKEINGNTIIRKVRVRNIQVKFKGYEELFKKTGKALHINPFIKEALLTEQTNLTDTNMMSKYLNNVERKFSITKDDDIIQFINVEYRKYLQDKTIFTLEDGLTLEEFEKQAQLQMNNEKIKEVFNAFRGRQSTIRAKSEGSIANIIRQFFEEFRKNMHVKTHYITAAITDYFKKEEEWDEKETIDYYKKLEDAYIPVRWSDETKDTTGKFTYFQLKNADDDYRELVNTVQEGTDRKLRRAFKRFQNERGYEKPKNLSQRFTGTSKIEEKLGHVFTDKLEQYVALIIYEYFKSNKKLVSITHGKIKGSGKAGYTIESAGFEDLIKVLDKIELNLLPTREVFNELTAIDNFNERYTNREQELKNNSKLLNTQIIKLSDILKRVYDDLIIRITKIVKDKLEEIINNQEKYNEGIFRVLQEKGFIEEMKT